MHLDCYLDCSASKLLSFHLFSRAYIQIYVYNCFPVELVNRISSLASCYLGKYLHNFKLSASKHIVASCTASEYDNSAIFSLRNENLITNKSKSVFWTSCCFNWWFQRSRTKCVPCMCIFLLFETGLLGLTPLW